MNKLFNQAAEIMVSYKPAIADKPIIASSLDAYNLFIDFFPVGTIGLQEKFVVLYMNRSNRALGIYPLSTGGISGTLVDLRLILSVGLKIVASSLMISHNHPSGNLKPSNADIELTKKIKEAGKLLDISLLDHLIISPIDKDYYSFMEHGIL